MIEALLPPAILAPLALALCVAGLRWAAAAALGLFLLGAMPAVLGGLLMLSAAPAGDGEAPGAIVIFSSPGSLEGQVASATLLRLRRGAALARRTGLPILVAGPEAGPEPFETAPAMASALETFGVRARWVAAGDGGPMGAVTASVASLRPAGVRSATLFASPWELKLASDLFAREGIAVQAPSEPPMQPDRLGPLEFVPLPSSLPDSADAVALLAARVAARARLR